MGPADPAMRVRGGRDLISAIGTGTVDCLRYEFPVGSQAKFCLFSETPDAPVVMIERRD